MSGGEPVRFDGFPEEYREQFEKAARGYGWPKFGHAAELRSLHYHASLRDKTRSDGPSREAREAIVQGVAEQYSSATWSIPEDFLQFSHFERVVKNLDWTSSPGYPYMRRAPTNRILFNVNSIGVPDPDKVSWMWEVVQNQIRDRVSDPIRLFIKAEPHKLKKLEDGRYRLISSVSVVDQLIDHMLFGDMNESLVENWLNVPSKIGWSHLWGGWRSIPRDWVAVDKSSWDWTMQSWVCEMVLEVRLRLCSNPSQEWLDLAQWRYRELFLNPLFVTSGGWILRQMRPGVMKSGCVNTIADNSIAQSILDVRVCYELGLSPEPLMSLGDDTYQKKRAAMGEYLERLSQYAILKQVVEAPEFGGFRFLGPKQVEPLYKGKHAYILLHVDPEVLPELAPSYQLLYHRSAYRDMMEDIFLRMGQEIVPRRTRDLIFDGY
ncbi:hypothetical protein 2 [Hubei sobemo-like virus 29]|uniref:hypothetical protein 2 n=1 Tax=Hubei sobemo-like virus 29 TaxID=1923215 RepID=UPI00090BA1C8|nr:hypothetical protein 2 [Hubei sobemo-like virus 29]APG75771.1 hypothetical protein 2 [Hubei sobemo-like virus 29]